MMILATVTVTGTYRDSVTVQFHFAFHETYSISFCPSHAYVSRPRAPGPGARHTVAAATATPGRSLFFKYGAIRVIVIIIFLRHILSLLIVGLRLIQCPYGAPQAQVRQAARSARPVGPCQAGHTRPV